MDWEAILATIRKQKLSKEQGLKLIEEERKRVEAARLEEQAAAEKAYEERRQLQEKELKKLREQLHALKMKAREAESKIESSHASGIELPERREIPEVGTLDSAGDSVEEELTTEEPSTHSERDKRMTGVPMEICVSEEQSVAEKEVAAPQNDSEFVIENESTDQQASDVRSQSNSEGNEDDRCPSHLINATRKGRRIPRRLRGRQRRKTRVHEKMNGSRRKKKKPELRQRHPKLHEKCATARKGRRQVGRRHAWEFRKRRKK